MALIETEALSRVYELDGGSITALDAVSLSIDSGEFVAVMGPSGSGKSTLMNLIGCLDRPTSGRYTLAGAVVESLDANGQAALRNREIGFVFQTFHLVSDLSVTDNVEIPLLYRRLPGSERRRRAEAALERVGLGSRMRHFPSQLSGGQQQRVAIARAIVGRPRILLADEPTGNLDSQMGDEIMALLKDLQATDGTTIVMVTHDPRQAEQTERIVRLFDGRMVN
jgi:putative ABC transport system ATP-binding protein